MKIIRQTILGAVIALTVCSCSTLIPENSRTDVLGKIQPGMSKQEIISTLGSPDYRRFEHDMEEWEFTRTLYGKDATATRTQIVISFENDRVVAMDSFDRDLHPMPVPPGGVIIDKPSAFHLKGMHPREFQRLYEKVKFLPFKEEQLDMLYVAARDNNLNCRQCAKLMSLFPFDDDKMKVLKMFASGIDDIENYDVILEELTSLFKKEDAKKILGIRR